jgi:hypothetical protein
MKHEMVRDKLKPERAAENVELVRAVYAELHETNPTGLRYATFRFDDGVSFVHRASTETADGSSHSRAVGVQALPRRKSTTAAKRDRS